MASTPARTNGHLQAIELLKLEYTALRTDILHRSAARFSMLTVSASVFAVVTAFIQSNHSRFGPAVLGILLLVLLVMACAWVDAGRSIGRLASRVAELENLLNELAIAAGISDAPLLRWENDQAARRTWVGRLINI